MLHFWSIIMTNLFTNTGLGIPAHQAVSSIASRPQTLQIVSGCVWVTVEGVSQDYWLSAGDSLTVTPGRLVVVESNGRDSYVKTQAASKPNAAFEFGAWLHDVTHRSLNNGVIAHRIQAQRGRSAANGCTCPA